MTTRACADPEPKGQRMPLSEWDNEGGAVRCGPKESTAVLPPPHPLTIQTASHMNELVDLAIHSRDAPRA